MNSKGFEKKLVVLNTEKLRLRIQECGYSNQVLADRLTVSIKTVQRWLNGQVKRVSPETLHNLASALDSPQAEISYENLELETLPRNKVLQEILNESNYQALKKNRQSESLSRLLGAFDSFTLPADQQLQYWIRYADVNFSLGKRKKGTLALEKALNLHRALGDETQMKELGRLLILKEYLAGNLSGALQYFSDYQNHILNTDAELIQAHIYFLLGEELKAEEQVKRFLIHFLRHKTSTTDSLFRGYFLYLQILLAKSELNKARKVLQRLQNKCERYAHGFASTELKYYLYLWKIKKGDVTVTVRKSMTFAGEVPQDLSLLRADALFKMLAGDFEGSRRSIVRRLACTRETPIFWAQSVADYVLLAKSSRGTTPLPKYLPEKALQIFLTTMCLRSHKQLNHLLAMPESKEDHELRQFYLY